MPTSKKPHMGAKTYDVLLPLRRYTTLPAVLDLLKEKRLTLVSPASWPDRNDSFYLELYKKGREAKSVLAVCLSEASETYHHWRIFAQSSDGVCIQFRRDLLLETLGSVRNLLHGPVEYIELNRAKPPALERLPFLKRYPYRDEKEYRIVSVDLKREVETKSFSIPLESVEKITLSPWLPKNLRNVVGETLCSAAGCEIRVSHTTLLDNKRWKNLGSRWNARSAEDNS
ncbi:MAG TPA: hypothetical protein VGK29_22865 [Paludibaculum sp.]